MFACWTLWIGDVIGPLFTISLYCMLFGGFIRPFAKQLPMPVNTITGWVRLDAQRNIR